MEEKRDQEEMMKHVCRLCNKRYPSGKSLGGHMRSHVIAAANSHKNNNKPIIIPKKIIHFHDVDDDEDDNDDDDVNNEDDDNEEEDQREGKQSGYGLRENPKKTWRLVDSKLNNGKQQQQQQQQQQQVVQFEQQERVCKQCGKGFNSLKALCGHMSSHSDLNHHKDANFKGGDEDDEEEEEDDDVSWSSGSKDQLLISAIESHSDNNNSNKLKKRQTRATMSRYKSLTAVDYVSPTCGGGGNGGGGGSSSNHSEIDQHEQEEVAMCLMMLSRDYSSSSAAAAHNNNGKSCFNFTTAAESSDNNSVILEGGSSNNYVGLNNVVAPTNCDKEALIKDRDNKKMKKIKVVGEQEQVEMDNSDSGYFENGAKELESDDSVDGLVRNFGFKKPKYEFGSSFNNNNYEDGGGDYSRKTRIREVGHHFGFDSPESDENSSKKIIKQDYNNNNNNNNGYYPNNSNNNASIMKKGSKYECWVCNKTFKTHQALGGHIISHRKNGENSLLEAKISAKKLAATTTAAAAKVVPSKAKKAKGHKCPYCPKVFKSGQALGGHKRSHMIGSSSNSILNLNNEKSRVERKPPTRLEPEQQKQKQQPPPLIDLNLPAPMEEEGSGNSQFVAW